MIRLYRTYCTQPQRMPHIPNGGTSSSTEDKAEDTKGEILIWDKEKGGKETGIGSRVAELILLRDPICRKAVLCHRVTAEHYLLFR
jgi:hypothetical protein